MKFKDLHNQDTSFSIGNILDVPRAGTAERFNFSCHKHFGFSNHLNPRVDKKDYLGNLFNVGEIRRRTQL